MNLKELLRWAIVIASGGFGLSNLSTCLHLLYDSHDERDFGRIFFALLFTLFMMVFSAVIPLLISYFVFRRQYRNLSTVAAVIAAMCVYSLLSSVPDYFVTDEFLTEAVKKNAWWVLVTLPLMLLMLIGPFLGAAWSFRFFRRCSNRYIHDGPQPLPADGTDFQPN